MFGRLCHELILKMCILLNGVNQCSVTISAIRFPSPFRITLFYFISLRVRQDSVTSFVVFLSTIVTMN